MKMWHKMHRIL